jgi:hypothetical protein
MNNWLKYSSPGVLVAIIAVSVMHYRAPVQTGSGPKLIGRPPSVWLSAASTDAEEPIGFSLGYDGTVMFAENGLNFKALNLKCDPYNGKSPGFRNCKVLNCKP